MKPASPPAIQHPQNLVISTEATDSLTVCCAVEKPASLPQPHPAANRLSSSPAPLNRHPERSRRTPKLSTKPPPYRTFQPHLPGAPLMQSHRMSGPSRKARSALLTQPKSAPQTVSFRPKQQTVSPSVAQWRNPLLYPNRKELHVTIPTTPKSKAHPKNRCHPYKSALSHPPAHFEDSFIIDSSSFPTTLFPRRLFTVVPSC